jgi:glycosyltransferase involved in cell wall biosynthesis
MRLALVTDAWKPQVNGVVTTLVELVRELQALDHTVEVIEPGQFRTRPCPGYPGIDLAVRPGRSMAQRLDALAPDALHIATEGPLGWAARRHARKRGWAFSTAFHTKFPEFVQAATGLPPGIGYAVLRHFHGASSGVMVPTRGVMRMLGERRFRNLREWTHGVDTTLFRYQPQARIYPPLGVLPRPVQLYVGRLSHEKNITAFLDLELPGTKVVCGVGPIEAALQRRYPQARWLGVLPREELAQLYASADVFVFPSRTDTFGLVMLEAMACGTPVAAFPVDGPLEVLGDAQGRVRGGVLHEDLRHATLRALAVPRHEARARALEFSWVQTAQRFLEHLVPLRRTDPAPGAGEIPALVTPASRKVVNNRS